ncbi:MAG: hypothetical protein WA771_04945 [Chthoniobacterales bacterium]
MNYVILTYVLYLILSLGLTVWVARTLSKNGRIFLVNCFRQNAPLADSVNHLLVVGFYLVNLGFVALFLKIGVAVQSAQAVFEALSGKMGIVLLVLGFMHFFNLVVFTKLRRRAIECAPPLPTNTPVGA